jgi:hypothetical protein
MNKYVKSYLLRGLIFGGFGPIVTGIILWLIQLSGVEVILSGGELLLTIVSTYLLAFIHAGSSIFHQIERWPLAKSMICQLSSLYDAYTSCYLVNQWLPFDWKVLAVFTGFFVVGYLAIWLSIFFIIRSTSKRLNKRIQNTIK